MMKLYYANGTISIASVIALYEAEIAFEPVHVNFAKAEQTTPEYHAINPKGRVPALITEHGILTETGAILDYIATLSPEKNLMPSDTWEAGYGRAVMYYLASTMHVNHAHRVRGIRWADQESSHKDMQAKTLQTMTESARFVEQNALRGTFVLGETFSVADAYLYVVCTWLEGDGVDVSAFPKIGAFRKAMAARASVQRVYDDGMLLRDA